MFGGCVSCRKSRKRLRKACSVLLKKVIRQVCVLLKNGDGQISTGLCLAKKSKTFRQASVSCWEKARKSFGGCVSCWKSRKRLPGQRHDSVLLKKVLRQVYVLLKNGGDKIPEVWVLLKNRKRFDRHLCLAGKRRGKKFRWLNACLAENHPKTLRQVFILLKTKTKSTGLCLPEKRLSVSCWTKKIKQMSCRSDEKEGASAWLSAERPKAKI